MSTVLKNARWEFPNGPLKNHWGFVGEGMGAVIDALELSHGMGRYEKVGKTTEKDPDGLERVVYELVHIDSAQRQEHAPSPAVVSIESRSYFPGMGCQCSARSEGECGCDADWTPSEVHDLRAMLKEARESLAFRRDLYRFQRKLMGEIREERDKLQQWKMRAMVVLDEWETVWVAAGSPGILGQSKASAVLQFIHEIAELP